MSISLSPQASIQKPFLNTLQEKPSNKDTNVIHIAQGILTRDEAKAYQSTLHPESKLFQTIDRNMALYSAGIREVAAGLKVNMTKDRLKGGFYAKIGTLLLSVLTNKTVQSTVGTFCQKAWSSIFGKEFVEGTSEEEAQENIADFQARFEKVENKDKEEFADTLEQMKQFIEGSLDTTKSEKMQQRKLTNAEEKLNELADFKDLIEQIKSTKVENSEVKEQMQSVSQNFQNCQKFIGNMGDMNVSGSGNVGINFGDTSNYQAGSKHEENKSTIKADKIGQLNQGPTSNYGGQQF